MAEELKKTKGILDKAYAEKDTEALRFELHRTRGALAYVKLPQLTEAFEMRILLMGLRVKNSLFHQGTEDKENAPYPVRSAPSCLRAPLGGG